METIQNPTQTPCLFLDYVCHGFSQNREYNVREDSPHRVVRVAHPRSEAIFLPLPPIPLRSQAPPPLSSDPREQHAGAVAPLRRRPAPRAAAPPSLPAAAAPPGRPCCRAAALPATAPCCHAAARLPCCCTAGSRPPGHARRRPLAPERLERAREVPPPDARLPLSDPGGGPRCGGGADGGGERGGGARGHGPRARCRRPPLLPPCRG